MPLQVVEIERHQQTPDEWFTVSPDVQHDWLTYLADRYRALRTETAIPLANVRLDGIVALDTTELQARLNAAMIPNRRGGNFDVLRSDFGEIISHCLLEDSFQTRFGYKSIRDRELIAFPGRGIDAIGVEYEESSRRLTLVLGETKVSNEARNPPRVVDEADDCLQVQHGGHLTNLNETTRKVWQAGRHARDRDTQQLLFAAAASLEQGVTQNFRVVVYCCLVRPNCRYQTQDFGTFRSAPNTYRPGAVRFAIFCVPDADIEGVIDSWNERILAAEEVA